jgi:hypothetical protein
VRRHDRLETLPISGAVVAVVLDTRDGRGVPAPVIASARRSAAAILIYDLSTGSRWTTPYDVEDTGAESGDRILSGDQLRHLGYGVTARAVDEVNHSGVRAGAYLASCSQGEELRELVRNMQVESVIVLSPLTGRAGRNIRNVRLDGATLIEISPNGLLMVHP